MSPDHNKQLHTSVETALPVRDSWSVSRPDQAAAVKLPPSNGVDGVPWSKWAAGLVPLAAGLAGLGARLLYLRRHAAQQSHRRQQLMVLAAATTLLTSALAARARWQNERAEQASLDTDEDPPLFV